MTHAYYTYMYGTETMSQGLQSTGTHTCTYSISPKKVNIPFLYYARSTFHSTQNLGQNSV